MISLHRLVQQRLTLWQRHCQERKAFYTTEIANRRTLGRRHSQERDNFPSSAFHSRQLATLLFQQASEIMEFRVINRERWWHLLDQQNQEKADFEATLKLAN